MSMSLKVFGNEVGYGHWEGRNEILERIRKLSPISKLHNLNKMNLDLLGKLTIKFKFKNITS